MNTLISVKNVTKIYNENQLPGLNNVSFDVESGEFEMEKGCLISQYNWLVGGLFFMRKNVSGFGCFKIEDCAFYSCCFGCCRLNLTCK